MKRLSFLLFLGLSACAGSSPYLNTYRAGVISKEVVTASHKELWNDPLREKAKGCKQTEPADGSAAEMDACMTPFTRDNNDKVLRAFASYQVAAGALSAILIAAEKNPDGVDKAALKAAISDAVDAARELLALFPKAQAWVDRLEMLLKGLV